MGQDHRQEGLYGFRGVAIACVAVADVVAHLPDTLLQRNGLDVADVGALLGQHRVHQGAVAVFVDARKKFDGLGGFFNGLEYLVRHEAAVILVQGIFMNSLGHIRGKFRDYESFGFDAHGSRILAYDNTIITHYGINFQYIRRKMFTKPRTSRLWTKNIFYSIMQKILGGKRYEKSKSALADFSCLF